MLADIDGPSRILIVDDDESFRILLRSALQSEGVEVDEATDGEEALRLIAKRQPDVVLLDVLMPGMDGVETCRQLRKRRDGRHVPILLMTGTENESAIHEAYDAGATDFVSKPVNPIVLSYRLRYMLHNRRTVDELRKSRRRLANAQRIARMGDWELDVARGTVDLSKEARRIFGLEADTFDGTVEKMLATVPGEERDWVETCFRNAIESDSALSVEHRLLTAGEGERVLYQEAEIAHRGARTLLVGTVQDVTARKEAERRIHHLANFDPLTGLPNRSFLSKLLQHLLKQAKRTEEHVALLSLDIDYFKQVNDTLGHQTGDAVLQEVAQRISKVVRGGGGSGSSKPAFTEGMRGDDIVARVGGDEFMIVLSEVRQAEDAAIAATRLKTAIAEPLSLRGQEVVLNASVGISLFPENGREAGVLLRCADAALHTAKESGRDVFQFYSEGMNERALERFSLEHALRKAIEGGELRLHFQPKLNIQTGEVEGMEALVRWEHPSLGTLPPAKFIPLAEQTGLIVPLGEWVFKTGLAQARAWRDAGLPPLRLSVNVSGRQFKQRGLPRRIQEILDEVGLDPDAVEIELTEGILMEDVDTSVEMLSELKSIGLVVALDDFGTGYSSLSYLKRFPIDILKIDRSFVRGVTTESDTAAIVTAVIAMAKKMGKIVVAEGVETEEELRFLQAQGCDEVQGFLFSKPLPATEFVNWLSARRTAAGYDSAGTLT